MSLFDKIHSNHKHSNIQNSSSPTTLITSENTSASNASDKTPVWFAKSCTIPSQSEIYYPDRIAHEPIEVERIELTEKQAVEQGWSFRKKSKRIRITNYHGTEKNIIIPSKIGDMIVNEIGSHAFEKSKLETVKIPGTIYKVREVAFAHSEVKEVIFGESVKTIIGNGAFFRCKNLEYVYLPSRVETIGENAFWDCTKLEYIIFPDYLREIGKEAFYLSGLRGFSAVNGSGFWDGSIFANTPIQNNYKLLITYENQYRTYILLVGKEANIKFPKGSNIKLCKNAVMFACTLDFSECSYIDLGRSSYKDDYDVYNMKYRSAKCYAVVPQYYNKLYFPDYVDVRYPDGSKYEGNIEIMQKNEKSARITVHSYTIPSETINLKLPTLFIDNDLCVIEKYAFADMKLKEIHFKTIKSYGQIFRSWCYNLREVHYEEYINNSKRIEISRYIPPQKLVGLRIHQKLLTAFTTVNKHRKNKHYISSPRDKYINEYFYDSVIVYDMFSKGYIECQDLISNLKEIIKLNQRIKIFIAVDVLRSTVTQHDIDTQIYKEYLRTHIRYAKIVCNKVKDTYPEYLDFLNTFDT